MANTIVRGQMIFQDENALAANGKKVVAAGKGKSSVGATKKKGVGLGNRKALHDITNKSKLKPQASSKLKNNTEAVDFDIAKEGFLHDHSKCIEQQQKHQGDSYYESIFLHGHDHNNKEEILEYNIKEMDDENDHAWEELKELPMDEFSDLLKCSTQWRSPPVSPVHYHSSLPSSPLAWPSETVEFKLKDENALAANAKSYVSDSLDLCSL